jgi:hypothetical protein
MKAARRASDIIEAQLLDLNYQHNLLELMADGVIRSEYDEETVKRMLEEKWADIEALNYAFTVIEQSY